ncbi:unnamed protein product [Calypogeia fissa]
MQKRAAEEADAPPGFPTVIAARARAGDKVKPPPMANSSMKGTVKASAEDKDNSIVFPPSAEQPLITTNEAAPPPMTKKRKYRKATMPTSPSGSIAGTDHKKPHPTTTLDDYARLKSQKELHGIQALQREKIEWEVEKIRLSNDNIILERSIASKAAVETADLSKKLVDKERSTISTQARLILSQGDQMNQRDHIVIVQQDNKIKQHQVMELQHQVYVLLVAFYVWQRRSCIPPKPGHPFVVRSIEHDSVCLRVNLVKINHKHLSVATKGFSEAVKLGQGGFGSVYKGELLSSSIEVTMKKIISGIHLNMAKVKVLLE